MLYLLKFVVRDILYLSVLFSRWFSAILLSFCIQSHEIVYWSPTQPGCQNRKCTCVNYRGISEYNLDRGRVEWVLFVTPTRRRWSSNFNQLEIRCGREDQHPAEGALRPPIEQLQLERRCWNENMSQRGWGPRPPVEQPRRTGKKHCYGHKSGGQYVAFLFGLQLPLTVKPLVTLSNPFNKVRGIFF